MYTCELVSVYVYMAESGGEKGNKKKTSKRGVINLNAARRGGGDVVSL